MAANALIPPFRRPLWIRAVGIFLTCALLLVAACKSFSTYLSLRAAYKPSSPEKFQPVTPPGSPPLKLFAGDSNYHLPDGELRAHPDLREIVQTIQNSGLDFVFFTPTVKSRFFENQGAIEDTVQQWRTQRQFLDTIPDPKPLFLPGIEYVDKDNGRISLLFLELPMLFADLKAKDFKGSPPLFFYTAKAFGALLSINTPLATPLSVVVDAHEKYASSDRSWKPISNPGQRINTFPPEIQAANELAYGMEAYSLPVAVWRDQYVSGDQLSSLHAVLKRMDELIMAKQQRMIPMAGSDSRGKLLHPTMFIAAPAKNGQALREGLLRGRVCIRAPEPCAMRVYADDDGLPKGVGAALRARQRLEFDWPGEGELFKNGESIGTFDKHATVAADPGCSIFRLVLEGGYSGPIYVNCPFAEHELAQ